MPVGRVILKSISESKKIADLKTDGARLLYTWLLTHLDINGCYSGDPQVINGKVFTRLSKSVKTIESYIQDLEERGLVLRYQVNGDVFLNVPDFVDKQPSLNPDREGKTNIPLPTPDLLRTNSGESPPKDKLSKDKLKISKDKINKEDDTPYDEIKDLYNDNCKLLPQVMTLSDKRKATIRIRFKKYGKERLEKLFKKAGESKFLTGKNNHNWRANFDWLLNENNMLKVLEGNYDTKNNNTDWMTK
jgi:hypothetical protein